MKKLTSIIALAIMLLSTVLVQAADVSAVSSGTQIDARRAARALASLNPTVRYYGSYNFLRTHLDGSTEWVYSSFRAKFYDIDGAKVLKPYQFSIGEKEIYNNEAAPLKCLPYNNVGVVSDIHADMTGYDANWQPTVFCEYHSQTWLKNQTLMFVARSVGEWVFIPVELAGRSPESVGMVIVEWKNENYPLPFSIEQGGFYVWVDPTVTYHYQLVDTSNWNAPIGLFGTFAWDDLPAEKPAGNPLFLLYQDGVRMVHFDKDGWFSHGPIGFNTEVLGVPAAVFGIDRGELLGQRLYIGFGNFVGRVQVEYLYADDSRQLVIDKISSDPLEWQNFELPSGAIGATLSFIQQPVPIVVHPEDQEPADTSYFYLNVSRPVVAVPVPPPGEKG